jgi:hypothetical protein
LLEAIRRSLLGGGFAVSSFNNRLKEDVREMEFREEKGGEQPASLNSPTAKKTIKKIK